MKNNMKWLMLIPLAVALAVVMAVFIPKILNSDSSSASASSNASSSQNSVTPEEMANYQASIETAQGDVTKNPTDLLALKSLGIAYEDLARAQGQNQDINGSLSSYKGAIDAFRKYLALSSTDAEVRIELGLAYTEMGLLDLGERELRNVTVAVPTNQRAWHSLGWALSQEGKIGEARTAWTTSMNLNPTSDIGQEDKQFLDQTAQGNVTSP